MKKRPIATILIAAWLVLIAIFMLLARRFDLEIFFVLWLIGILVIVELIETRQVRPPWLQYVKYLIAAGIILFGAIVARKVLEILAR